jgi:hypothetical protein
MFLLTLCHYSGAAARCFFPRESSAPNMADAMTASPPGLLSHSRTPSKAIIGRRSSTKDGKDVAAAGQAG